MKIVISDCDHAIYLMLALVRKIPMMNQYTKHERAVGIIGMGRIGKTFANRISGFDCRALAVDKSYELGTKVVGAEIVTFEAMFGFSKKVGNSSIFAGAEVEAMKKPFLGKMGHLAIATTSIPRAAQYLESRGFKLDLDTANQKNGQIKAVYFKDEVGGFAVHLLQK